MLLRKIFTLFLFTLILCTLSQRSMAQSPCVATITPAQEASFCPGGFVKLTANSGTNLRYQWFLNNVALNSSPSTSSTYDARVPGAYQVKVTSSSSSGCTGALSEIVVVTENIPPTAADFSTSPSTPACSGTPITLTVVNPETSYTYKWDFGDNSTGEGTSVSHSFYAENVAGQVFTVTLETIDLKGCSSFLEKSLTVKPGPVIKLNNDQNFTNCQGGPLVLRVNDASVVPAGDTYEYIIDWGDNKPAENINQPSPPINQSHTYASGAFKLRYTIKSTSGCTVIKEYNIENRNSFIMNATNNQVKMQCIPYTFQFSLIDFEVNHPSTKYLVDFGDGASKLYTHAELLELKEEQRDKNLPWTVEHEYKTSSCTAPGGEFIFSVSPINECKVGKTVTIPLTLNPATPTPNFRIPNWKACATIPTVFTNLTAESKVFECNKNTRYVWSWGDGTPDTETISRSNPSHIFEAPGTYKVTLKVLNDCSPSETSPIPIMVVMPPKAAFTTTINPENACVEATVRTTNNSTGENPRYTWAVFPNKDYHLAPGSTLTDKEPVFVFSKPGSHHIRLTTTNDCKSDTTSQKVLFKGLPTVTLPGSKTYCGSEPQTLTFGPGTAAHTPTYTESSSAITAYHWEVEGGIYAFVNSTTANSKYPVIQFSSNGTYTVRITATNECGNSITASQAVKVTILGDNAIALTTTTYCSGTPTGLITGTTPPTDTNIIWESRTENTSFEPADGIYDEVNYSPGVLQETTWFRRKVKIGDCEHISAVIKVTIDKPIIKNTIYGAQDLCASSTPDIITGSDPDGGNGKFEFIWESSRDDINFASATGTRNLRDYQSGEILEPTWFRRRVISGMCRESISESVKITVTPGVSNNTIGTAQRICKGTDAALLIGSTPVGGDNNIKILWEISLQSASSGFEIAPEVNNLKDYQPRNLVRDSWFRRTIISGGCKSISRVVKITVDNIIENNIIAGAQTICTQTKPTLLTGSTHTGGNENYTYEWEMSTDGIVYTTAPGISHQKDYAPPVLTQSTWFRRVIYANPCGASESEPILIKVLPAITQNHLLVDQTICAGATPKTITGTSPQGSSGTYIYFWEMSTVDSPESFGPAPGNNQEADYTPPPLSVTTYFRRTVIAAPCQQVTSNSVKIQVNPIPEMPIVADVITCLGAPATLTATGKAETFAWYTEETGGLPVQMGTTFTTPAIYHKTTYYVASQSTSCASARVPITVTTYNAVADAGQDVTITKGNKVLLKASGGTKYTWSPPAGLNNTSVVNPIAAPQETTTYRVTVQSPEGCTSDDEVTITVIPKIIPTNGITPNGDGANDTWVIKHIEYYPEADIQIFNRWGNKIFTSKGYTTPWDGTLNGQPLPVAAYYYIIKLTKDDVPISGNITLIR